MTCKRSSSAEHVATISHSRPSASKIAATSFGLFCSSSNRRNVPPGESADRDVREKPIEHLAAVHAPGPRRRDTPACHLLADEGESGRG